MVEEIPTAEFNYDWSKAQLELTGEQLKAIADPTRVKILYALRDGGERSPTQMALEHGMPLGRLAYHVRLMRETGVIEETRWEPVRGAVERFYKLTPTGFEWVYCLGMAAPPEAEDL